MGIKNFASKLTNQGDNAVAKTSSLSSEQLKNVQDKRNQYFLGLSSVNDAEHSQRLLAANSIEIYNAYLTQIKDLYVPIKKEVEYDSSFDENYNIRYLNITKWVTDKKENSLEKLVNVYEVLSNEDCNIALVFHKTIFSTEVYLAVTNTRNEMSNIDVNSYINRIQGAIKGNFPGSEWKDDIGVGVIPYLDTDCNYSVASTTNIPTEKSEKFMSQTIEKLLDGITPNTDEEEYTIILLATPVKDISERKMRLCKMYSDLAPYSTWSTNYTFTDTESMSSSATVGLSGGIGTIPKGMEKLVPGFNFGMNFARQSSVTATIGKNEGITKNFTNYNVKYTLEKLEKQMQRLEQSTALGMWDFAAYVLSEDMNVANNVAHSYLALTQGEESHMSESAIHLWRGDMGDSSEDAKEICDYLKEFRHPLFGLNPNIIERDPDYLVYPEIVTLTTSLTGKELAYSLNFPSKSVIGLPVIQCAEFGRNVITYNLTNEQSESIQLGKIFHMNQVEKTELNLDLNSLASHTFITGSTGVGKSNTVYQILNEARKHDTHFLVVEPAKGEYKYVFGNRPDVKVFGTNPKQMPLLKLNPFSFPQDVHVLEHIDRLVEIFNVCWPMYAAMPAVLKNAIEDSYVDCGWDLVTSQNKYDNQYYPSFKDICRNIKAIINSSEYDNENKGAYKGSLLTRLQSLTNGIYGLMFSNDELSNEELFDSNVIVDLSRIGSMETKSLLMGMLVLKLQEYRMSSFTMTNQNLKHITVLEEAHHLLKRTSMEQTGESANLLGKSVEMIANAIAEMRTYGEGFIVADQAPGLLDMSTIRNTNTKIIMRLPDKSDRELVGFSANLNEDQITELSKLPRGVAAVYQNEWIQPVLCKVNKANVVEEDYIYDGLNLEKLKFNTEDCLLIANALSACKVIENDKTLSEIKDKVNYLPIDSSIKVLIMSWITNSPKEPRMTKLAPIMSALFPELEESLITSYAESRDPEEWTRSVEQRMDNCFSNQIDIQVKRDIIQCIITNYLYLELNNKTDLQSWAELGGLL